MTDDFAEAKARNQALVRTQRESLKTDKRDRVERGISRITLGITAAKVPPTDEQIDEAIEAAKLKLRKDVQGKGGCVDRVTAVKLLNGDIEVRAEFTAKVGLDS